MGPLLWQVGMNTPLISSTVLPPDYLYNQCTFSERGKLLLMSTHRDIKHYPGQIDKGSVLRL